jgi:hypothetical protein
MVVSRSLGDWTVTIDMTSSAPKPENAGAPGAETESGGHPHGRTRPAERP